MATPAQITDHALRAVDLLPAHLRRLGRPRPAGWLASARGLLGPEDDGPYAVAASDVALRQVTVSGDRRHRFRAGGPATLSSAGTVAAVTVVASSHSEATGQTTVTLAESFAALAPGATLAGRPTHGVQELETVLVRMRADQSIGGGVGVQLDRLGSLIGLPRTSTSDATYRNGLAVQAAANAGHGTPEELIAAALGFTGATAATLLELAPAAAWLQLHGALPSTDDRRRLRAMKPSGVRLDLTTSGADVPFGFGDERAADGVAVAYAGDPRAGGFCEVWTPAAVTVDPGTGRTAIDVVGDLTAALRAADRIRVAGQPPWDGVYVLLSSVLVAGSTRLTIAETLAGALTSARVLQHQTQDQVGGHAALGALAELL